MANQRLRVGLVGAGGNTRFRHIPGLRALPDVEITAVCNRRPESTAAIAREFAVPRTFSQWQDLVADTDIDAIVIGTWPYLHCPITLAALAAGKHVLTEARLSMNTAEAMQMLSAAHAHPKLVTQVVPSPFGLKGNKIMIELIEEGFLGQLREVHVFGLNAGLADPASPLSWRQDAALSGYNMLTLGIIHETLLRWVPRPVRVLAQVQAFIPRRTDPQSGVSRAVGTPDNVQVLALLENGAHATYHISGVTPFGQHSAIHQYGSEGFLSYDLVDDRIFGASTKRGDKPGKSTDLKEIPIPADKAGGWRVEADFVDSIRLGAPVKFTSFADGIKYMEFTEAVALSAQRGEALHLGSMRDWEPERDDDEEDTGIPSSEITS